MKRMTFPLSSSLILNEILLLVATAINLFRLMISGSTDVVTLNNSVVNFNLFAHFSQAVYLETMVVQELFHILPSCARVVIPLCNPYVPPVVDFDTDTVIRLHEDTIACIHDELIGPEGVLSNQAILEIMFWIIGVITLIGFKLILFVLFLRCKDTTIP